MGKEIITKEELIQIINDFNPKIKQALLNTHFQDRQDLEQEIKLKIIESYDKISKLEAPNFEEFFINFLKTNDISSN